MKIEEQGRNLLSLSSLGSEVTPGTRDYLNPVNNVYVFKCLIDMRGAFILLLWAL